MNFFIHRKKCVYDNKVINTNNNEINLLTTKGEEEYKDQLYGLPKETKNGRIDFFVFMTLIKITIEISSSLSNINICYYLKLPIPIKHRQLFRIISQNPEV